MGEAKRRKEIALHRNPEYNSDPFVPWTKSDWEKLKTTFGSLTEPDLLAALAQKGFKEKARGVVLLSIYEGKLAAGYLSSSEVLLNLYESGFKNRLQECFYTYNPRTDFILMVTYNDVVTSNECTYDFIPRKFGQTTLAIE